MPKLIGGVTPGPFAEVSKQWVKPTIMQRFWQHFYHALKKLAEMFKKNVNDLIECAVNTSDFIKIIANVHYKLTTET